MNTDLIHCPKCGKDMPFIRVDKNVRIYELPKDETETIHVIQCDVCGYPIAAYPEHIHQDSISPIQR